jgi:chromosome segregation ATPase
MARYRDEAPVGNTCPLIDSVISLIDNLSNYDITDDDEKKDMLHDVKVANDILEEIRSANSSLRDWGNELYSDKEDLEKENNLLKGEISDLSNEVENYKGEVKELESQIIELENNNY